MLELTYLVKFHSFSIQWVLKTWMRKLYWGSTGWGNRGTELSYLCKVQTKPVAELQVKSRPRGSPFIAITVRAFSFQGFSMSSLKRLINPKITGSASCREGIHIWFSWGRLNRWGRFYFCCILIVMKSQTDEHYTLTHAVGSADSYVRWLDWKSQCSVNRNQPFEWGRWYVLPG